MMLRKNTTTASTKTKLEKTLVDGPSGLVRAGSRQMTKEQALGELRHCRLEGWQLWAPPRSAPTKQRRGGKTSKRSMRTTTRGEQQHEIERHEHRHLQTTMCPDDGDMLEVTTSKTSGTTRTIRSQPRQWMPTRNTVGESSSKLRGLEVNNSPQRRCEMRIQLELGGSPTTRMATTKNSHVRKWARQQRRPRT